MKRIAILTVGVMFAVMNAAFPQTPESLGIFEAAGDIGMPSHKGSVAYDAHR